MKTLFFKRLNPIAKLPKRAYNSAGYDVWPTETGVIPSGQRKVIPLGFATAFDPGYAAIIDDRGSTGFKGLTHLAGVIDADYRGEYMVIMYNSATEPYEYSPDKAIAQILFLKVEEPNVVEVATLPESIRDSGKLGSSGH